MRSNKVTNLVNKGLFQDSLEDALIFLESAYKLHKQEQIPIIESNYNINLEVLSPSNLAVKYLLIETKEIQ